MYILHHATLCTCPWLELYVPLLCVLLPSKIADTYLLQCVVFGTFVALCMASSDSSCVTIIWLLVYPLSCRFLSETVVLFSLMNFPSTFLTYCPSILSFLNLHLHQFWVMPLSLIASLASSFCLLVPVMFGVSILYVSFMVSTIFLFPSHVRTYTNVGYVFQL